MNKLITIAALAIAVAIGGTASAAIAPTTYTEAATKADRLDGPAMNKSDLSPVLGPVFGGSVVIGYQTDGNAVDLIRVPAVLGYQG